MTLACKLTLHTPRLQDVRLANILQLRNTPGQIRVLENVPWNGQAPYRISPWNEWYLTNGSGKNKKAGQYKHAGKLWFVTVDDAGHAVPADQPEGALKIINKWIS